MEFGRATVVHVAITPEITAERISPVFERRLEALRSSGARSANRASGTIDPRPPARDGPQFVREVAFRTPHVEAAGLGYLEDHAREISICLRGSSTPEADRSGI